MSDYIIRATAANDGIRAFAITSREMVELAYLEVAMNIQFPTKRSALVILNSRNMMLKQV